MNSANTPADVSLSISSQINAINEIKEMNNDVAKKAYNIIYSLQEICDWFCDKSIPTFTPNKKIHDVNITGIIINKMISLIPNRSKKPTLDIILLITDFLFCIDSQSNQNQIVLQ